ncbi:hypothetical protein HPB50_014049 [Hyalomma asiaticum]|uniref:Uncharacterized protein n=1 Tax=Hyalomma asiaticum TaxID=266040 RepID=A0ACB7SW71_HYAAI|nr:hypothetical protein HPB50_014049 [Hyalomma asiaticum]
MPRSQPMFLQIAVTWVFCSGLLSSFRLAAVSAPFDELLPTSFLPDVNGTVNFSWKPMSATVPTAASWALCPGVIGSGRLTADSLPIIEPPRVPSIPDLDVTNYLVWQPRSATATLGARTAGYKCQSGASHFGLDTASKMPRSQPMFLQALESVRELKDGYAALVTQHNAVLDEMKQLRLKVDALEKDYATRLTAGDIAVPAFSDMSEKLKFAEHEIKRLNAKVVSLEQAGASAAATAPAAPADTLREVTDQLMSITSRCDEAENRMRRSNLLFFGLEDHANEDWAASEQKIIKFCSEKLQLTLTGTQF